RTKTILADWKIVNMKEEAGMFDRSMHFNIVRDMLPLSESLKCNLDAAAFYEDHL
ncbi:hypothetical protein A2U01_0092392, partial [Trifolium medium]|nr:hypothetical protein [Trifolium medium]